MSDLSVGRANVHARCSGAGEGLTQYKIEKRFNKRSNKDMGININLLRADKGGNPDLVKASQRKRGGDAAVALVDEVMALDADWIKGILL